MADMTPSQHVTAEMVERALDAFHWPGWRAESDPELVVSKTVRMKAALTAALSAMPGQVAGWKLVPEKPTRDMLNAAVDVDSFKLGDISPLGFRMSPQMLFERCYTAMLAVSPTPPTAQEG